MGSQWVTCTEDIFPANPAMGISTPRWIWDPDVYFETQICLKLLQVLAVVWMQHSAKSNHFVIAQGTWKQVLYLDIQVVIFRFWKKKPFGIWHHFFNFDPGFVCPVIESKGSLIEINGLPIFAPQVPTRTGNLPTQSQALLSYLINVEVQTQICKPL